MSFSHLKQVVAPNMADSLGVFVASREPCIGMAASPPARGRLSQRVLPEDLDGIDLPPSHAIAVVLCPGDDTRAVARLAVARSVPAERFYFFYTAKTRLADALAAWTEAGLPVLYSHEVEDWRGLNKKFGAFWNAWVHDDHCGIDGCRMR